MTYAYDEDGSLVLKARLPALAGALVLKALDAALMMSDENVSDVGENVPAGTSVT